MSDYWRKFSAILVSFGAALHIMDDLLHAKSTVSLRPENIARVYSDLERIEQIVRCS